MNNLGVKSVVATGLALGMAAPSQALVVDFFGGAVPTGLLPSSFVFSDPGSSVAITVSGFYFDGADWQPTNLFGHDQTNGPGLGVCSPGEAAGGGCSESEIDSNGARELILLELGPGYEWVSVSFSGLDMVGGGDQGQLWFDIDGDVPFFTDPFGQLSATFTAGGANAPVFDEFPVGSLTSRLFIEPFNPSLPPAPIASGFGVDTAATTTEPRVDDFLVQSATIQQTTAVPEPSSLLVFGAGLAALGLRARRGRQRPSTPAAI